MDNQNLNITKKFSPVKIIFIILAALVVAEVIWAVLTIFRPTQNNIVQLPSETTTPVSTISLSADKNRLKVGEKVTVAINIFSSSATDGTDLIILFDPKLLTVENPSKPPVAVGSIYSDYPVNRIDPNIPGKIIVSGIASKTGGILPSGVFGTITFVAKATGATNVSLNFTKGSTSDTNVTETGTGKDILDSVQNLNLTINQ